MAGVPPRVPPNGVVNGGKARVKATTKLAHLKFMQKAAAKAETAAKATAADKEAEPSTVEQAVASGASEHWTTGGSRQAGGCQVIIEDAPPPGAPLGRLSFGAFNPAIEALQAATDTAAAAQPAAQAASRNGTADAISDEAMAATLGGNAPGVSNNTSATVAPASGASRAEAARKEALASMTRPQLGRINSPADKPVSNHADNSNGLLPLSPTVAKLEEATPYGSSKKQKHRRGLLEGEQYIAPLRHMKRKKHGR